MQRRLTSNQFLALAGLLLAVFHGPAQAEQRAVSLAADGRLQYASDEFGNRISDFSNCGYAGGDQPIPDVSEIVRVAPGPGDDGLRIQTAIDFVARRPANEAGIRGAVV